MNYPKLDLNRYSDVCVLVVDMQKFFYRRDNWPEENIDNIKKVIGIAKEHEMPVRYLISSYAKERDSLSMIPGFEPGEGEVIEKRSGNGFSNEFYTSDLDDVLEKLDIKTLIMVGGNLCQCVYATFLGGKDKYRVVIPVDATVCNNGKPIGNCSIMKDHNINKGICNSPQEFRKKGGIMTDMNHFLIECQQSLA
ncbi:MAG: isochorismatase family protein [archaeon]|nr:isochorismatase family protein [archaeon]